MVSIEISLIKPLFEINHENRIHPHQFLSLLNFQNNEVNTLLILICIFLISLDLKLYQLFEKHDKLNQDQYIVQSDLTLYEPILKKSSDWEYKNEYGSIIDKTRQNIL